MLLNAWERFSRGSSTRGRRIARFLVASLLVASFILLWFNIDESRVLYKLNEYTQPPPLSTQQRCRLDDKTIEHYKLSKPVHYLRREVIARQSASKQNTPERLDIPLFDVRKLNMTDPDGQQVPDACSDPITVTVPIPPKRVDASHIIFGVATTYDRLYESLDGFAHWAGHSNAHIYALIEPHGKLGKLRSKAESLGIVLDIQESDIEYNMRYFSLLRLLHDNLEEGTQWGCVIDDDTFFLSMPRLVERLRSYDATKPYYVGGLSESQPQIGVFGVMGFGGAGVFLSRPLLTELNQVYDICQEMEGTGDRKIARCIYQYTDTKLTVDHGLRQLDLMGDASGFFEAGRQQPLSVHHWKSWYHADMVKLSAVSAVCGDSCLLQQWRFKDDWILTNGFSVIRYSEPRPDGDFSMERTWEDHNGAVQDSFLHALGPLRPKDDGKFSYQLEDAIVEDGQVRQLYVHRGLPEGDFVLELVWRSE
ncbi:hypothetical protein VTN00DRAFT_490 [Thermoascus crustaceus]|uniref:uncharacterized protein n=1 Tax=Thermoascus crustaceus TaxID=5088 RepID=UPI003742CAEE